MSGKEKKKQREDRTQIMTPKEAAKYLGIHSVINTDKYLAQLPLFKNLIHASELAQDEKQAFINILQERADRLNGLSA